MITEAETLDLLNDPSIATPFHRAAFSQTKSEVRGGVIYRTHTVRNACKYFVDSVVVGIIIAQ